jgi:para-nitrobenzyl esterase
VDSNQSKHRTIASQEENNMRIRGSLIKTLAIILVILAALTGCARSAAPTRLVNAAPAGTGIAIPTSANNVGAGDVLAILRGQAVSLSSSSFADASTWNAQRDALVSAVDESIGDVNRGEYTAAADVLKNGFQGPVNNQILLQDRDKLTRLAGVALDCIGNAANTTVDTRYGKVAGAAGLVESWMWKGLPYAKPPIGELRWRASQDPEAWTGVRQSTDSFDMAVQPAVSKNWVPQGDVSGSEDCLYLNIWRPKTEEKNLPVYLWIHGGGNNFGSGKLYEGSILAARSNMVVVCINYRLGPLGWFNHPSLRTGSPSDNSGNYGLLDAIKALQWVRDNISGFGGDPGNVTVAGESAGGRNTLSLLISPLSSGLFQRAICESGGMPTISVEDGVKLANSTVEKLLVNDGTVKEASAAGKYLEKMSNDEIAKYLRSKTPAELIKAETNDKGGMYLHSAFEDGYVIPGNVVSVIATGNYNHVPVIMGSNEYELKPFLPLYGAAIPTSNFHHWADLYKALDGSLTLNDVMPSQFDRDLYEACGYYGSRNWKATYMDSIARQLKTKQDDVYCYFFKWGGRGSGPQPYDFIIGAGHATEIPFFFGWPRDTFGYAFTGENHGGWGALQTDIMSYASQFARTGNPNAPGGGLPVWERWSNDTGAAKCIVFDGTFIQAKISMMTDELTVQGVQAEIEALPPLIKGMVKLWARSPTS